MCFRFSFCFFSRSFYRSYKLYNRIKNLCNNCKIIKKDKSIIKKNRKKHKMVLFAKSKLNSINVLISKALTDSNISLDESIIINNVLKECHDI